MYIPTPTHVRYITVPKVECSDLVSADGIITVQWNLVHTGGLNLTGLSAEYSYVDGTSTVVEPVTVDSLNTTTIKQHGLVTGFEYTFRITAANGNGSSTATCRPILHTIGEYYSFQLLQDSLVYEHVHANQTLVGSTFCRFHSYLPFHLIKLQKSLHV